MTGSCRLCGKQKKLCNSHIIPEWCYKPLYEDRHRFYELHPDGTSTLRRQQGIREHLLCECCEGRLNKWFETPFHTYWFDLQRSPRVQAAAGAVTIPQFDYSIFKLFHLSILWKASLSSDAYFRCVSLGPYEDKIRQLIWDRDPKPEDHYPLIGVLLVDEEEPRQVRCEFITPPGRSRLFGCHAYSLSYIGCEWIWLVTDHPNPEVKRYSEWFARENGSMLMRVKQWTESIGIKAFLDIGRKRR